MWQCDNVRYILYCWFGLTCTLEAPDVILFVQSYQGLAVLQLLPTPGTLVLPQGRQGGRGGLHLLHPHLAISLRLDTFLAQTVLTSERHSLPSRKWILTPEMSY